MKKWFLLWRSSYRLMAMIFPPIVKVVSRITRLSVGNPNVTCRLKWNTPELHTAQPLDYLSPIIVTGANTRYSGTWTPGWPCCLICNYYSKISVSNFALINVFLPSVNLIETFRWYGTVATQRPLLPTVIPSTSSLSFFDHWIYALVCFATIYLPFTWVD